MKICVIGLDGLSNNTIFYYVKRGYMPNFRKMIDISSILKLDSYIPLTFPSWTSILAGVNPSKHGILDFFKYKFHNGYENITMYSALDLKHPRIHEMISLCGSSIKVFIVDPIPGFPIIPLQGNCTIISFAYFLPRPVSTPADAFKKYYSYDAWHITKKPLKSFSCISAVKMSIKLIEHHTKALQKAIENKFDLIWITINLPDMVFHTCPKLFNSDKLGILFTKIDELLKKAFEHVDYLFIVSDHGFSRYKYNVNVNKILLQKGFLKLSYKNKLLYLLMRAMKSKIISNNSKLAFHVKLEKMISILSRIEKNNKNISISIDYNKSKAFLPLSSKLKAYLFAKKELITELNRIFEKYGLIFEPLDNIRNACENNKVRLVINWNSKVGVIPANYTSICETIYYPKISKHTIVNHSRYGTFIVIRNHGLKEVLKDLHVVPNTIVTPIIMSLFKLPLSVQTDELQFFMKKFNAKLKNYSYLWAIQKLKYRKYKKGHKQAIFAN